MVKTIDQGDLETIMPPRNEVEGQSAVTRSPRSYSIFRDPKLRSEYLFHIPHSLCQFLTREMLTKYTENTPLKVHSCVE